MQRFEIARSILERLALSQAGSGCREIDHIRAQSKCCQLERCARPCARLDKKIHQRLSAQRGHLLDLAGADLFECVGGLENEIDFVSRQFAQAEQIFSCPACGHQVANAFIAFPSVPRRVHDRFVRAVRAPFRYPKWANSCQRNRGEWAARDDRGRLVLQAEFVRAVRMN
jgi:hypothetical protein